MKSILAILLMLLQTHVAAQTAKQLWSKQLEPGLQWTFIGGDGTFITASTEEASNDSTVFQFTVLRGLDPLNGNVRWKSTPLEQSLIPGADAIPKSTYLKLRTPLLVIIDPMDGRLVIDPQLYNVVFNTGFLTEPSRVWIEGMFGNTREFSVFDLQTGKRLWSKSDYFLPPKKEEHKKYGFDKTVSQVVVKVKPPEDKSSPPGLLSTPVVPDNEHMILEIGDRVNYKDVYKISTIDGDVELKTSGPADKVPFFEKEPPSQKVTLPPGVTVHQNENIEARKNGVLLYSDQSVRFINSDGSTRYSNHYNKVSEFQTEIFKTLMKDGIRISTGNILVLFTITDGRKTLEIIDKDSGETISRVNVDPSDNKPVFQVDETNRRLFYLYQDNLTAFDFTK